MTARLTAGRAGRGATDDFAPYLLELQRGLGSHRDVPGAGRTGIAALHGGAYGLGVIYAKTMFGGHEGH